MDNRLLYLRIKEATETDTKILIDVAAKMAGIERIQLMDILLEHIDEFPDVKIDGEYFVNKKLKAEREEEERRQLIVEKQKIGPQVFTKAVKNHGKSEMTQSGTKDEESPQPIMTITTCPNCGFKLTQQIEACPGCGAEFEWPEEIEFEEESEEDYEEIEEIDMTHLGDENDNSQIGCPNCGFKLTQQIEACPGCGAEFEWPED
jgi:RNA polymerase subunit RPABC4/transcription elongation factor Spt4